MPRRPEIGNIQLYPNRPLKPSDKNGYVLKFYCPIQQKRIRKNTGTRDRREARKILRECRERLLNGEYVDSGGAITKAHEAAMPNQVLPGPAFREEGKSWQECYEKYRSNRMKRVRPRSLEDAMLRLNVAERIFEAANESHGIPEGLPVQQVMTLEMLEYLQDRLLEGDESRFDVRSPNTVNSMMGAVMAFVRYCHSHGWISQVPALQKLDTDDVMRGRPVTGEEFGRMIEAAPATVGKSVAESWQFALHVLWESGFRVGDLMDFHWEDTSHIHPVWPNRTGRHPTLIIPSTQKNGRVQEIPMLPGLEQLLKTVPKSERKGWVADPRPMVFEIAGKEEWFRPSKADLRKLANRYNNCAIAAACCVSETTVRKWLRDGSVERSPEIQMSVGRMTDGEVEKLRSRSQCLRAVTGTRPADRLTKERVSRVIGMIGKEAGILVQTVDPKTGRRQKFASAHDLRRGCAQRLINAGVSAESLKVIMRHKDFATTEKHYDAIRTAQSAAEEVISKLALNTNSPISGGINGGTETGDQLSPEELSKLKRLLNSL